MWWQEAVFYQVYPRSFADSDGDGVGDLEGLRRRLDHLAWLGVDAVWICPFYPSPMADFGYDVADYCDVDPLFGTLADFDGLVADAHARGLRVIVDWVPNHTSDRHPWFVESRASRDSPKRDWYVWRDGSRRSGYAGRPNNWRAAFGGDAWTFDDASGQWYLHLFLPGQPDLNWRNPEVVGAMHGVLRFWLDREVDGFRIDVVQGLAKDPDLADDPPGTVLPRSATNDHPDAHPLLRDLRRLVDSYPQDPVMVGEVYLLATEQVVPYLGRGDELHLAFDFTSLYAPWTAAAWRATLERVAAQLDPVGGWPTWTLSNHDNVRHASRYGGEAQARAAAVLLLTVRGTPFLYAGEELGLEDAVVPAERVVDPGGRDPCRAPIPWDASPSHGWAGAGADGAWLPWPPGPDVRNWDTERDDPASVLHLYRRLLTARRGSAALRRGGLRLLDGLAAEVLAYERWSDGGDRRTVLVNFGPGPAETPVEGGWTVEVAADGRGEGQLFAGCLPGNGAVVLGPA
ncbi:MAG: alpha-amylase family glycosyl hydrolase [Acidimicrobiales bacterium]